MSQTHYDIVIIGGGLAGTSLACALRSFPLKIAIIESRPWATQQDAATYDDRVIALNYISQRIFVGMQMWDKISPYATPIQHIHVSDKGHFGFTHLDHTQLNIPALGYVIRAKQLGQLLQLALYDKQHAEIDILSPAQLQHVQLDDDNINITVEINGQSQHLHSDLLIGADGGQSKVCQDLNMTQQQQDYGQTAIIANVTMEKSHNHVAYERFTESGPVALLPLENNDCSLVWTVKQDDVDKIMAYSETHFLQHLQHHFGWRLGQFNTIGQRTAYPLKLLHTPPSPYFNVAMIGNAAHTLHPVAGQGLNLGLRDVASLAQTIVDAHKMGQSLNNQDLLNHFHAWQQPDQKHTILLTDNLVKIFSNHFLPLVIARNVGLLVTDAMPFFKKQLAQQMAGFNGYPSRLTRGLPLI